MERFTNNSILNKNRELNNYQLFFIQRWLELLNINTHSKYAIKYLNIHQSLKEVVSVCEASVNNELKSKEIHLQYVFDEAKELANNDLIIKKHSPNHLSIIKKAIEVNKSDFKNDSKINSKIFKLKYVIKYLENNFLQWIIDDLQNNLNINGDLESNQKDLKNLEALIQCLVSELLSKGWSIKKLYNIVKEELMNSSMEAREWECFFQGFMSEKEEFSCLFSFPNQPSKDFLDALSKLTNNVYVGAEVKTKFFEVSGLEFISDEHIFYLQIVESYDQYSAVNIAWQNMQTKFDILRFYGFEIPETSISPVIITNSDNKLHRNTKVQLVDDKKKYKAPERLYKGAHNILLNNSNNLEARRIKNLLEFNRISEQSLAPQSTFLNLWIGLESFTQSLENDGINENVKMVVKAASSYNYIYSILKNFIADCKRCKPEVRHHLNDRIIKTDRLKPIDLLRLLSIPKQAAIIKRSCYEKNILLGYRCEEVLETVLNGREASKMIKSHRKTLERHIQRLYRTRNEITHSGNVDSDLTLFIRHLHEYIEATMTVVISMLDEKDLSIEEVFAFVRDNVETTIEVIKNKDEFDDETFFDLLLTGAIKL